jgi:Fe-S-cluster containining protein
MTVFKLRFYIFYAVFILNEYTLRNPAWREGLWFHMRLQLFVIQGGCQHSGNCCRSLMLVQDGHSVDTPEAYEALVKKTPSYSRFTPVLGKSREGLSRIQRFRCTCLTQDNRCNDYANRPRICHQYPMSMFIKLGYIHAGCGYKVQFRGFYPYVRHPVFWSLVFRAMRDNRLGNETLQVLR